MKFYSYLLFPNRFIRLNELLYINELLNILYLNKMMKYIFQNFF